MPLIPWLYVAPSTPAPNDAKYIVQTANTDLSAEQALGDLSTGPLRVTTGTGVVAAGPINVASEITGTVPTSNLGSGVADGTTYLRGDNTWATPSGSGAPASASYVTLGTDGTLTQERVLTGSSRVSVTDAGAGSTVTLDVPDGGISYAKIQDVSAASKLIGRGDSGSGDAQEISLGTGLSMSGTTISASGSGKIAQAVSTIVTTSTTGSTQIPTDDTIPQNTEGVEFMTLAITPTNSGSTLLINVIINLACSAARTMTAALFQDTTGNALAAGANLIALANGNTQVNVTHAMTAGTTSSTTFKVRAGANASGTVTFNGNSGTRLYGGVCASSIVITEVLP